MFIFSNSPCQVNCEVLILAERSGAGRTGFQQTPAIFDRAEFHNWAIEICGVVGVAGVVGVKLCHHWVTEEYSSRGWEGSRGGAEWVGFEVSAFGIWHGACVSVLKCVDTMLHFFAFLLLGVWMR